MLFANSTDKLRELKTERILMFLRLIIYAYLQMDQKDSLFIKNSATPV